MVRFSFDVTIVFGAFLLFASCFIVCVMCVPVLIVVFVGGGPAIFCFLMCICCAIFCANFSHVHVCAMLCACV